MWPDSVRPRMKEVSARVYELMKRVAFKYKKDNNGK
jgi:hypothetical protein